MRERLIVVGGRQRKQALNLSEWQAYEAGVVLEIDLDGVKNGKDANEKVRRVVDYKTPSELCADESPSIVFKAGDLDNERKRLIVCTQTEILEFDLETWRQTFYFSHRWFNDLHHVCYFGSDQLLVANTGLDQILQIELERQDPEESKIVSEWSTCSEETWSRFDKAKDYRKVATTKPHLAHPNFVFSFLDEIYATRFHQEDAVNVGDPSKCFDVSVGNPHDGILLDSQVTFTTTNGHLVTFDLASRKNIATIDLNEFSSHENSLGWCRGLAFGENSEAWVGFSRIRPTWLRKNLSWIKQGFQTKGLYGTLPTRIAKYDLETLRLIRQIDLEPFDLNAVFGIYRVRK